MNFRKLSAPRVFNGRRFLEDTVLVLQQDGTVEALMPLTEAGDGIEWVEGILLPGFINCHCHIELSHLKGAVAPGTGLVPFLKEVVAKRQVGNDVKEEAMQSAMKELWNSGVTGVADICNTADSLQLKQKDSLRWQTLVEVISVKDAAAADRIRQSKEIENLFLQAGLKAGLVPHAPYSVGAETFKALNIETAGGLVSIHNQETAAEDELFRNGSGDFIGFYTGLGYASSPMPTSGRSSLQTWLPHFTEGQTILMVHNTFSKEEDLLFAKQHAQRHGLKLVYCLCPNANLYIENRLPSIELLIKYDCKIVLGTDSYASNLQLDIWSEIATVTKALPKLPLPTLLQWATLNGAEALGWNDLGQFKRGAQPGVVVISEDRTVKRLV